MKYFKYFIIIFIILSLSYSRGSDNKKTESKETDLLTFSKIDRALKLSEGENVKVAVIDWQFDLTGKQRGKYIHPVSMAPGEDIGKLKPWHGEWMAEIVHKVAPKVKIIPIKAKSLSNREYEKYLIKGIYYAADKGAVAVSSSMGPLEYSEELKKAIDYAELNGMIFVDVHPEYTIGKDGKKKFCKEGKCDNRIIHTGVVSVPEHPTTPKLNRDIYTWPYDLDKNYEDGWGYSNAPPIVVGVIALIKSIYPELSNAEVRRIIIETAEEYNGFNVLNSLEAVKLAKKMKEKFRK
ncbi:MAG: S8/S53 family peptidase [Acidobacteriota bacterium]